MDSWHSRLNHLTGVGTLNWGPCLAPLTLAADLAIPQGADFPGWLRFPFVCTHDPFLHEFDIGKRETLDNEPAMIGDGYGHGWI